MSDTPERNYFQPSLGSISGFDATNLPGTNPSLSKTGWSITQLQQFLLNISDINFPTEDWVRKVDELITSHISDFNNPHHVTLDQIASNFTRDVLGNIIPGTPPNNAPFFAYNAFCPLPLNDIFPATYSYSNLYAMNAGGVLVDHSQDTELVGIDYSTGKAGLPLFLNFTNTIPQNWVTQTTTPIGTTLTKANVNTLSYPFNFYTVAEAANNNGPFGLRIPCAPDAGSSFSVTVFILPTVVGGSLLINCEGNNTDIVTVDLTANTTSVSSGGMLVEVYPYSSGVIRISICFPAGQMTSSGHVVITHLNPNATSPNRPSQANRALFSIGYPLVCSTSVNHPVPINTLSAATTSAMALTLSTAGIPATLASVMLTLTLNIYPSPSSDSTLYDPVLTFGNLIIKRDQTYLYLYLGSTKLFSSTILEGLNIISISYSASTIIFKDLATSRQTTTGTFSALSTATASVGRFNGYLQSLAFYIGQDTNQCLEFLTNG